MTVECVAIIAILLMVGVAYHRSKKPGYAALCLVLVLLPAMHLLGNLFLRSQVKICLLADLTAAAVTALLIGVLSARVPNRAFRLLVDFITIVYTILLFYLLNQSRFALI